MNGPDGPDPYPSRAAGVAGELILQRFRVERVLGRGGMGEVLLAEDTVLHRRVALKRLRSDGAEGAARRSAVLKEARRAGRISDRRIAAIHDVLDLGDDVLIVMEYVDGDTLRARMSRPLAPAEFWDLASQCVEAVAVAHGHGLIHRDIKPENLMVTRDGGIKILDFGIARHSDAAVGGAGTVATTMTTEDRAAVIAGTPQYMAPEAHYGGRLDERTDIFSLGTVFYELLTGRNPFAAPTYQEVLERVMTAHPDAVGSVRPGVGPALSELVARMMAKEPARRQASCAEVLRELDLARSSAPAAGARTGAAPATVRGGRRIRPGFAIAAVGVAVTAAALSLWLAAAGPPLPEDRHLAVLPPVTGEVREDFATFALGAVELLSARLQRHQEERGFQLASFTETVEEGVRSAPDARTVQGARLALVPVLEQRSDAYHARLELWDTAKGRRVASRIIEAPVAEPFRFMDRLYAEAGALLGLRPVPGDARAATGVHGAGTLRFLLQGMGRLRGAKDEAQARRAVDDLELARRAEPEAAVTLAWLALAQRRCFALGNDRDWVDRADASAREAVARDSTRPEAHRALGLARLLQKDDRGAVLAFERACALDPTDDDTASRLGSAYGRIGRRDRELESYRSVIARRPHCWHPYWWLANAHYRRGEVDEAVRAFRELVHRAPDLYRGYSYLGGLLVLDGRYDAAIDSLRRSVALRPTKVAFDNLGTAYFNSGRIAEAVDAYNQAFQFGLAEYDSWLNLGEAYHFLQGRQDRAADAYAQAIRLGRERIASRSREGRSLDVMVPANLATVFPKLGQTDSARAYLRRALAADSTNTMVQVCAALTLWQLGERERAVGWLDRAVRGGYPVAWLRDSPVFREWRGHDGFRALVARAGGQAPDGASPN